MPTEKIISEIKALKNKEVDLTDPDVLSWFKSGKGKYQSKINRVLRDYMTRHIVHKPSEKARS